MWIAYALCAGVWIWVAVAADDEVAGHFDMSGNVTRWDTKWSFLGVLGGVILVLGVLCALARRLIGRVPGQMVNLPGRSAHDYWTAPENRPDFDRKMSADLEWLGAATALLIAWIVGVAGSATDDGVDVWILAAPTVLYVVAVLAYTAYVVWGGRYRVPRTD
jgi:hypothetical protein